MDSYEHFSKIAKNYKDLRTTDLEPIHFIVKKISHLPKIEMVEIGCGDGRYSIEFIKSLGNKLHLHCIDTSPEMLDCLQIFFTQNKINNFEVATASAEKTPLENQSVNCIVTLNAIHHFKLLEFLEEASRILVDDGYLFIYTRLRSQNSKNIFGKYFPLFCQKETRLYELNELEEALQRFPNLSLQSSKLFSYERCVDLNRLIYQAKNHHYSTFSLFSKNEFEQSLKKFIQNIKMNFKELENIKWTDEYNLIIINKTKK